jgi:hypothetical protein
MMRTRVLLSRPIPDRLAHDPPDQFDPLPGERQDLDVALLIERRPRDVAVLDTTSDVRLIDPVW